MSFLRERLFRKNLLYLSELIMKSISFDEDCASVEELEMIDNSVVEHVYVFFNDITFFEVLVLNLGLMEIRVAVKDGELDIKNPLAYLEDNAYFYVC